MPNYLIRIQLHNAMPDASVDLLHAMQMENFIPVAGINAANNSFSYYGNQDLLHINDTVQKAMLRKGLKGSFTIIKDKLKEKQFHAGSKS